MEEQTIMITFYTKAGCHLCDDARELLNELARAWTFIVEEIDIRRDPVLFELYKYRIPVMLFCNTGTEQKALLEAPITNEQLRNILSKITDSPDTEAEIIEYIVLHEYMEFFHHIV